MQQLKCIRFRQQLSRERSSSSRSSTRTKNNFFTQENEMRFMTGKSEHDQVRIQTWEGVKHTGRKKSDRWDKETKWERQGKGESFQTIETMSHVRIISRLHFHIPDEAHDFMFTFTWHLLTGENDGHLLPSNILLHLLENKVPKMIGELKKDTQTGEDKWQTSNERERDAW